MKKITLLFSVLYLISCSSQEPSKGNPSINKNLQNKLQLYLNFLSQYQEERNIISILDDIAQGDTNIIKHLEREIQLIKDNIEMDSIFRVFTEEPAFNKKTLAEVQESYRLTIFNHLANTIEIVRINQFNKNYNIIYKKYRINNCQPPIISGKPLEKTCFELIKKQEKVLKEREWKESQKFVRETDFWFIPLTHFSKNCFDGSNWTLEGWRHREYKVIDSRCPGDYNPIKILGESLLNLSKS